MPLNTYTNSWVKYNDEIHKILNDDPNTNNSNDDAIPLGQGKMTQYAENY